MAGLIDTRFRMGLTAFVLCGGMVIVACAAPTKSLNPDPVSEKAAVASYSNPLIDAHLADPNIVKAGDEFFLYATGAAQDGRHIPIYRSDNLVNWTFVRGAVAQGKPGAWNRLNFWAPEVAFIEGRYHLYYTASVDGTPGNTGNRVGHAVADKPEGPFEDVGVVVRHGSIDGHPFQDHKGAWFMYYTIEQGNADGLKAGQIYVDKMIGTDAVEGSPMPIMTQYAWQEGAHLLMRNGHYYLTFSTGSWRRGTYKVQWAIGDNARGPFEVQDSLLLQSNEVVKGPGHHSFLRVGDRDFIVYHGWDAQFRGRYPRIDRLYVTASGLSTRGPTSTPQPMPLGPDVPLNKLAPTAGDRAVKILCLGDSITQGRRGQGSERKPEFSYRYNLWKKTIEASLDVDFVGSMNGGFEGDPVWPNHWGHAFDRDHEGHWGWTLDQIKAELPVWLKTYDADIALIMLGTNDVGKKDNPDTMVREAKEIFDLLRADNPKITIVWGHTFQEWDPFPVFRDKMNKMIAKASTAQSPILTVDHSVGWVSDPDAPDTRTIDWVHTAPLGDEHLAAGFWRVLEPLLRGR